MAGYNLLTPGHRSIRRYYENAAALRDQGVLNEMSVRSPFESLLQETARLKNWTFIAELSGKSGGGLIRPDGTLRDRNSLPRTLVVPIMSSAHYNGRKDCLSRGRCETWTRDTVRFLSARVHHPCQEVELGREFMREIVGCMTIQILE
jgi:hypothetical protein